MRLDLKYVSLPTWMSSPVSPRKAGTVKLALTFLFAMSRSASSDVPSSGSDWPSAETVPDTVSSRWTLFASAEPLTVDELQEHVGEGDIEVALGQLALHYEGRGIELVERGGRWHFQTAPDLAHLLRRTREEPRRLSRAATETLAIIAYHEPVSRAEIEAIRGVQISKGTLDVLMEAGWVRTAGRRESPGRPLLYATTQEFLTHFGLASRRDLPGIDDLKAAGLLDPLDDGVLEALGQLQLESEEEQD